MAGFMSCKDRVIEKCVSSSQQEVTRGKSRSATTTERQFSLCGAVTLRTNDSDATNCIATSAPQRRADVVGVHAHTRVRRPATPATVVDGV
jgi:hypothetical protein